VFSTFSSAQGSRKAASNASSKSRLGSSHGGGRSTPQGVSNNKRGDFRAVDAPCIPVSGRTAGAEHSILSQILSENENDTGSTPETWWASGMAPAGIPTYIDIEIYKYIDCIVTIRNHDLNTGLAESGLGPGVEMSVGKIIGDFAIAQGLKPQVCL